MKSIIYCLVLNFCCLKCGGVAIASEPGGFNKVSGTLMDNYSGDKDSRNTFFSFISRIRYVKRWSLFKNSEEESLEAHSFEVAVIAHALATIKNEKFGGNVDADRTAVLGLFHDVLEVITCDIPTPTKYFDPEMKKMCMKLEEKVSDELLDKIEDEGIREKYSELIVPRSGEELSDEDKELFTIVKSADDLSALIKSLREKRNGNNDFDKVYERLSEKLKNNEREEVKYFMENYLKSYCC